MRKTSTTATSTHPCYCADTDYHPNVGGHGRACVPVTAVWEKGYRYLLTGREAHQLAEFFESGEITPEDVLMRLEDAA
jgi:hypothetical protein